METQGLSKAFPLLGYLEGVPAMQMLCCLVSYEYYPKFFSQVRTIGFFLYLSNCLESHKK